MLMVQPSCKMYQGLLATLLKIGNSVAKGIDNPLENL
jgi:hypothetical protein